MEDVSDKKETNGSVVEPLEAKDAQQAQVIYSFLEYLQDLKKQSTLSEDALESSEVAIQCLTSAFGIDLENEDQRKKYSIRPQSLPTVFGLGLTGKERISQAYEKMQKKQQQLQAIIGDSSDIEYKFYQYILNLKRKGFFNGVTPGTTEYEQRFTRARQKFMETFTPQPQSHPQSQPQSHPDGEPSNPSSPSSFYTSTSSTSSAQHVELPSITKELKAKLSETEKIELAEKYKLEGNSRLQEKQYKKAAESYSNAIELNPNNAIYYANRAAAYSHLAMHEKAIEDCNMSIALKPDYGKAYGRLGLAYFSLGKYKEAAEQYKKALEYEPNSQSIKESLAAAEKKLNEASPSTSASSTTPMPQIERRGMGGVFNDPNFVNTFNSMFGGAVPGAPRSPRSASTPTSSPTPPATSIPTAATPPTSNSPLTGPTSSPPFNFNDILGNPQFQTMASQMLNNPAMASMAQNLMQNPETVNNLLRSFGVDPNAIPEDQERPAQ